jgi:hypothetical protein
MSQTIDKIEYFKLNLLNDPKQAKIRTTYPFLVFCAEDAHNVFLSISGIQ